MFGSDCYVAGPLSHLIAWKLTPRDKTVLVETYTMAERLVQYEADDRVLKRAFRYYTLMLIDQELVDEQGGRMLIENVERADTEVARAALHRANCQLLRVMSGLFPCGHGCCCRCEAAYPDIACNGWVNRDHSGETFS